MPLLRRALELSITAIARSESWCETGCWLLDCVAASAAAVMQADTLESVHMGAMVPLAATESLAATQQQQHEAAAMARRRQRQKSLAGGDG